MFKSCRSDGDRVRRAEGSWRRLLLASWLGFSFGSACVPGTGSSSAGAPSGAAAPSGAESRAEATSSGCEPIPDAEFSWDRFVARLQKDEGVRRVEDALCLLPESFRSRYALAYESRSVQKATPQAPRAIFFGSTAGERLLTMSFNGDPTARGYDKIEAIRTVDDGSGRIEQMDVVFRDDRAPAVARNPQSCLGCHGSRIASDDRRWLFDAAPIWEGFFGSQLFAGQELESAKEERSDFQAFKRAAPSHPRYKWLVGLASRLNDPRVDPALPEAEARARSMAGMNFEFVKSMADSNRLRVARLIKSSENYAQYKYAIYAALACPNPSLAIPEELSPWHRNQSTLVDEIRRASFGPDAQAAATAFYERAKRDSLFGTASLDRIQESVALATREPRLAQAAKFLIDGEIKQEGYGATPGRQAFLRLIFEGRAKPISMAEWNVDADLAKYRFNNNAAVDDDVVALRPFLREGDADLADAPDEGLAAGGDARALAESCEKLTERSRQALRPFAFLWPAPPPPETAPPEPSPEAGRALAESACMHCHVGGRAAPRIDFHDPSAIQSYGKEACKRLRADDDAPEKMPRFLRLEESELASLKAYFQKLDPSYACD